MSVVAPVSRRYVVVCRGPHCRERGSLPLRRRLVELLRGRDDVSLVGYACFGQCERGPNVAFYPEGEWYGGLDAAGDAELVVEHALQGCAMQRPQLQLPDVERLDHLRNIAELIGVHKRDSARRSRWWWPF